MIPTGWLQNVWEEFQWESSNDGVSETRCLEPDQQLIAMNISASEADWTKGMYCVTHPNSQCHQDKRRCVGEAEKMEEWRDFCCCCFVGFSLVFRVRGCLFFSFVCLLVLFWFWFLKWNFLLWGGIAREDKEGLEGERNQGAWYEIPKDSIKKLC